MAAIEHGDRGVYNVVDDDPAPVAEWLATLAHELGAEKPMRVPRFIGRLFAGETGCGDDDRRPRRVEREGQARAGVAPGASELAAGVRRGMTDRESTARRAAAGRVRDRRHRRLGSVSEAEDVVPEALLRVHQALDGASRSRHRTHSRRP